MPVSEADLRHRFKNCDTSSRMFGLREPGTFQNLRHSELSEVNRKSR
eukprot:gene17588-23124_t